MSGTMTPMNANNGNEEDIEMRKGPWTFEEDNILIHYIACHGQRNWNTLAKYSGLKRSGKSCRLRWLNYLRPDIKRGNLTIQEQLLILELHSKFGNRWSRIAQHLPGRTDNEIKNYWRTKVQKQARQLNIDSSSKRFVEAIRYFWMPRLIEQMEQNLLPLQSSSSCSTSEKLEIQDQSTISPFQPNIKLGIINQYYENTTSVANSIPEKLMNTNYLYHHSANMDGSIYDCMEGFHLDATSSVEIHDGLLMNSQMAGSDWVHDDMASTVWDKNELQ